MSNRQPWGLEIQQKNGFRASELHALVILLLVVIMLILVFTCILLVIFNLSVYSCSYSSTCIPLPLSLLLFFSFIWSLVFFSPIFLHHIYFCSLSGAGWPYYAFLTAAAGHLAWQIGTVNLSCRADCNKKWVSVDDLVHH